MCWCLFFIGQNFRIFWLIKFCRSKIYKEIERKNGLNDKFNSFLTIITILGGGFFIIISKLIELNREESNNFILVISIIIVSILTILFIWIFKYMNEVHYENQYTYLRTSGEIEAKIRVYQNYYSEYYEEYFKNTNKTVDELVEERIEEDIKLNLIEATDKNVQTNTMRIKKNSILNKLILTISVILAITYIITLFIPNDDIIKVKIENIKEVELQNGK